VFDKNCPLRINLEIANLGQPITNCYCKNIFVSNETGGIPTIKKTKISVCIVSYHFSYVVFEANRDLRREGKET